MFFESHEGIVYLKVLKDVALISKNTSFEVCPPPFNDSRMQFITPDRLVTHKGQIMVIPSMYWSLGDASLK